MALDGDLRDVIDRQAVSDLLVRYVLALDSHDWEAVAGCFAPDAVFLHPGGQVAGPGAIVSRARAALEPLDGSQHLLGSIAGDGRRRCGPGDVVLPRPARSLRRPGRRSLRHRRDVPGSPAPRRRRVGHRGAGAGLQLAKREPRGHRPLIRREESNPRPRPTSPDRRPVGSAPWSGSAGSTRRSCTSRRPPTTCMWRGRPCSTPATRPARRTSGSSPSCSAPGSHRLPALRKRLANARLGYTQPDWINVDVDPADHIVLHATTATSKPSPRACSPSRSTASRPLWETARRARAARRPERHRS